MNPFCPIYFPTNVVFLDDNPLFLETLIHGLNQTNQIFKKYSDPLELLRNLNEGFKPDPIEMNWVARDGNEKLDHRMLDADITSLHQEIYRDNRFDEISVVVVDYHMPGMDGVEFCSQLRLKHVYKVLLTGHADDSVGIEALNKGIIHQFIRKHDKNLLSTLDKVIQTGQRCFFTRATAKTLKALEGDRIFSDPVYLNLLESVFEQLGAVEYYLIDTQGSMLMFDDIGNQHVLFIASDNQQESLVDIATEIGAPSDVIQSFRDRTKIFCKYTEDGRAWPDAKLWQNYLHDARKLVGQNPFYYAIASGCFDIDLAQVKVFGSKGGVRKTETTCCGVIKNA